MKSLKTLLFFILLGIAFVSCETEDDTEEVQIEVNEFSIIPNSYSGRPNNYLGCVEISSRITTIEVWDHGLIDGDIVSIIANGETIIDEQILDGPGNPIRVNYDFSFNGFNYLTLYAHNLGDVPPNTCTVSINGTEFILEANLEANGAIDVVVSGYGVTCGDSQGGNGNGNGGGNGSGIGSVVFWVAEDFGCGPITVNVQNVGSSNISAFFTTGAPDCTGNGAGGNFNNLQVGDYTFTASCSTFNWSGSFSVTEDGCLRFQLT